MRAPADPVIAYTLTPRWNWRTVKSVIMTSLMLLAFVLIAIPLFAIVWSLISRGLGVVVQGFPDFFTSSIPEWLTVNAP